MTAEPIEQDRPQRDLPKALERLHEAIWALIDPRTMMAADGKKTAPSLYMQLWDAVPSEQITGRRELSATAVTWIDALRLRMEIDTRVEIEHPALAGVPPTVGRLKSLVEKKWTPEQTRYVEKFADALEQWADDIDDLLNPSPKWSLAAACPACGKRTVHKNDSAGERVREAALQIDANGCTCKACRYTWGVERFQILDAVIRSERRKGVNGMTVAELMEKLSRVEPDTLVVTDDSSRFHYVTDFDVVRVPAAITDEESALGPFVQKYDQKRDKGDPTNVIVLSHFEQGENAVEL